ncbi:Transmembrane and coiled-coil domain-containing protein 4 [Nymphaea thermarum]|nr:Transmembrane and coiled-coil domain-containing protein 4 [Nymphaea thermarum]
MAAADLTPTERYAAASLFALALRQAQIHQTAPLGFHPPDGNDGDGDGDQRSSNAERSKKELEGDQERLWTHKSCGLLRPVLSCLDVDRKSWSAIEETAAMPSPKHHIGAFLRILSEENCDRPPEILDQFLALAKSVDATVMSLEDDPVSPTAEGMYVAYDNKAEVVSKFAAESRKRFQLQGSGVYSDGEMLGRCRSNEGEIVEGKMENYHCKLVVMYELLSACLADTSESDKKNSRMKKGYDARHRVALRLLATWFDIRWNKMEALELIISCSAMASVKANEAQSEVHENQTTWSRWKQGGIIGAAALTGGTLLAITGGLAAPAIAAGFGALAPTLGTLVPVIGASGFAAAATAAGSVAGSVAVAASFGAAGAGLAGTKMARRIGDLDEFEFKRIDESQNQGRLAVGIMVSGFVFEEEDFLRPWEGQRGCLERYALQWESKNLIAVSTAIQDWLTSSLTTELMRQGAMLTVLSSLVAALAWPSTLLAATNFIDSKWAIAVDRPVTLIGYSVGARVIFKCLQRLAKSHNSAEIVEKVVLLGAPIPSRDENWEAARKVVAGRFVNAYSTNDWMLGVAFRASLLTEGLAGIEPVEVSGIENVDVTEVIDGHSSYLHCTQQIVERLELDTYYPVYRDLTVAGRVGPGQTRRQTSSTSELMTRKNIPI